MSPPPHSPSQPNPTSAAVAAMHFLADGTRLRILTLLAQRESCVGDLIEALALSQPLVSYHLRQLREVGLVRTRRQGQWIFYSLDPEGRERVTKPIREVCAVLEVPPEAHFGASDICGGAER